MKKWPTLNTQSVVWDPHTTVTTQEVNDCTTSVFRAKARVTIMYWIVHNLVDIPVSDHLTQAPTSRRTGGFKFHAPYTHTLGYQHAFFTDSVGMWNNLPSAVMEAARLDLFKDQLAKLHVLKTAPNSQTCIVTSSIIVSYYYALS